MKTKIFAFLLVAAVLAGIIPMASAIDYSPIAYDVAEEIGLSDEYILVKSNWYNDDTRFSEGLCVFSIKTKPIDGYIYGYTDINGNTIIAPRFSYAGEFSDGLAFVHEQGSQLGGYIDKTGKYILPPVFDYAEPFKDGKALVRIGDYYTIIDKTGKELLSKKYARLDFNDNLQRYIGLYNGLTDIITDDLKIEKTFDYSLGYIDGQTYWRTGTYDWGNRLFAIFYVGSNNGILDYKTGDVIIPADAESYIDFRDGVFIRENYNRETESATSTIYDLDGNVKAVIDSEVLFDHFDNEMLIGRNRKNGKIKIYDLDGNLKFSSERTAEVKILSENLFFVAEYYDDITPDDFDYSKAEWYFYRNNTKEPTSLFVAGMLNDNFFQVLDYSAFYSVKQDVRPPSGAMDKKGNMVIPMEYDDIAGWNYENKEMFIATKDNTTFILDKSGKIITTIQNAIITHASSQTAYLMVEYKDGRQGFMDIHGNSILTLNSSEVWLSEMNELGCFRLRYNDERYVAINKTMADSKVPEYTPLTPVKLAAKPLFTEDKTVFLVVGSYKKYVNDAFSSLDDFTSATPIISGNRTLVPIRLLAECFDGIYVDWNQENRQVDITCGTRRICLFIDSNKMSITDFDADKNEFVTMKIEMDVPAQIIDNRTYIPLRAVSEALDLDVYWDHDTRLIGVGTVSAEPSAEQMNVLIPGFETK